MLKSDDLKVKTVNGMMWKLAEKAGMQIAQFAIQIILARLLLPEEYGLVGLLTIFTTVSDVFIQQGFTTALIQKKNADEIDFSSVFFANIVMSVLIYAILYFCAPFVAVFYNQPKLTSLMRVLSLNVVIGALCAVHNAVLAKNLDFKKSFYRNTFNVATQGVVGISAAYMGLGPWALVLSKVTGTLMGTIVLCFTVKWKPILKFSINKVRNLFKFSSKILVTNLMNTIFNNIHSLLIGRYYTSADLGFYQKGQQLPQTFMIAIDGSFNEVMYPALSKMQDNVDGLKSTLRKSMKLSMFIVLPVLLGLLAVAEPLVIILLTEKWLPAVPFIRLQCIICAFWPLSVRTHALNAMGRSDVTLKLSIIAKTITLVLLIASIRYGIYTIMLSTICTSCITVWITSHYVNKYIRYSLKEFIMDLLPCIALSVFMMCIVLTIGLLPIHNIIKFIVQVVVGVLVYVAGAKLFKFEAFEYVLNILKGFWKKK